MTGRELLQVEGVERVGRELLPLATTSSASAASCSRWRSRRGITGRELLQVDHVGRVTGRELLQVDHVERVGR